MNTNPNQGPSLTQRVNCGIVISAFEFVLIRVHSWLNCAFEGELGEALADYVLANFLRPQPGKWSLTEVPGEYTIKQPPHR